MDVIDDDDMYWRLHALSKALESSGRIDAADYPDAYATVLDAMNALRSQALADAARFRWLDEVALSVDMVADPDNLVQVWHETSSGHATTGRTLREAVDEAMKWHNPC